jgi:signal transduction histidine kinase/ActR/RegA family two-component response regulator
MCAASFALPALCLVVVGWLSAHHIAANANAALEQLSAVAREHALKVVETNALVLDRMQDRVRGLDWAAIEAQGEAIHRDIAELDERIEQITALHLIRPDGRLAMISIAWPTPAGDLSGRSYFRTLRARPSSDPALVFGEAARGRTSGVVSFTMSRARLAPDGGFDGVLLGSVMPAYFQHHWQTMEPTGRFGFRLMRLDGLVLAQVPELPALPTEPPPESETVPALRRIGELQYLFDRSAADELVAYRRIGTHPLAVSVSLPQAELRAQWYRVVGLTAFLCLLAAASLGVASLRAIRSWRSEQAVLHQLHATAAELRAEIARREAAEEGLREAQRLEAVGRLTGGVAHDFNNLLTAILGTVDLLERHLGAAADRQVGRLLDAARNAVHRGARLTGSLLAFARRQRLESTAVDINALVQGFAPIIERAVGDSTMLRLELGAGLPSCQADASQVENALLNLALNARDAMPGGGMLTIRTARAKLSQSQLADNPDAAPGDYVTVSVGDNGVGMPAEVRARAFEPFFSTKPVGKGTGLGLSQVFGFIRQSKGHVVLQSAPGQGTVITLFLPFALADQAGASEPAPAAAAEHAGDGAPVRVLLAEDDETVRALTAEALREAGFLVMAADDAVAALALLRGGAACDVLVSDIVMPGGMAGPELARAARLLRADLPVLLVTGFAGPLQAAAEGGIDVLAKPYDFARLFERIRMLAAQRSRTASSA